MKRIISFALIVLLLISGMTLLVTAQEKSVDTFFDNTPLTRQLLAAVLAELFKYDESFYVRESDVFSDVFQGTYYAKAIDWCYRSGILTTVGNKKFNPTGTIKRADLAIVISHVMNVTAAEQSTVEFFDVPLNVYYTSAVKAVATNDLMTWETKDNKHYFYPNKTAELSDLLALFKAKEGDDITAFNFAMTDGTLSFVYDAKNEMIVVTGSGAVAQQSTGKTSFLALFLHKVKHIVFSDGITSIGAQELYGASSLYTVSLPASLSFVETNVFRDQGVVDTIFYGGTRNSWNAVQFSGGNDGVKSAAIFFEQEIHAHSFGEYVYGQDATCKNDGTIRARCTAKGCSAELFQILEGSGGYHVFSRFFSNGDATRDYDGTETAWCDFNCGETYVRIEKGSKLYNTNLIFTDLAQKSWYLPYIDYAYTHELFMGTSNTTFSPETPMTRSMFVAVLYRLSGSQPAKNVTLPFKDVPNNQWYSEAVRWAYSTGVAVGIRDDMFGVNDKITREQLCTMLLRFSKVKNIQLKQRSDGSIFLDKDKISPWAMEAVYACKNARLVTGMTPTTPGLIPHPTQKSYEFKPQSFATRAQAAKILSDFHLGYLR